MLINLIVFNLLWLGLVYWGNNFVLVALIALALHIRYHCKGKRELLLISIVTSIGILVDSLLTYLQIFIFSHQYFIPFWLMVLWACFAATLLHSLHFLSPSKLLQAVMGLIFGPLSYIAGEKLGAVQFGYSQTVTFLVLAIIWTVLLVSFYQINNTLKNRELADV